jgi:DNA-binding response OmpR family regulator/chromosome segregation ATPase
MVAVKTILLVEDDQVASTMYQSRLEREGFHVETAPDGLTALKTLMKLTVDLVILDLILPKLDGANVLKRMRVTPPLRNVPVIVLSNAASTELDEDAMLTSPTRRLHKTDCPFSLLMQTIQELFEVTSAQTTQAEPAAAGGAALASGNGQPKPGGDKTAVYSRSPKRSEFLKAVLQKIPEIREHCCAYIRAPGSPANIPHLVELHQRANWVRTSAEDFGCTRIAMLARALEALLSEIKVKPSVITPSILQTIAQAVDCLALLLKSDEVDLARPMARAKILAVDDDPVCSMVAVNSLRRANYDAEAINDPVAALQKLQTTSVDAVLLDISMPGITGFELCEKVRRLPHCKTIPVIFITSYSNFDNRKQSVLSGGQDFITKPIFPLELALKTTLHLLKAQVQHPILHNVTPEPGTAGTRTTSLPEVEKPDPSVLRAAGSRFTQSEPAIPIPSAATHSLEMRAETSAAFTPEARAAASPGTARSSTMESPVSMPPQTAPSVPNEPRMHAEAQNETTPVPPARPPPGEERPARSSRGETEPAGLPDERSKLQIKLAAEQQAAAKQRQDFVAFQRELHENAAALEKARVELQQQTAGLTGTAAAAQQAQNALREKESLCSRLEQELAGLRTGRDELQARLAVAEKTAARVQHDFEALRKQAHSDATLLAKARVDLQGQSARLNTASAAAEQARKALQEKEARCSQLQQELTGLRESATSLAQARAELQQQSGKLNAATATAAKAEETLRETEARCGRLEEAMADLHDVRSELQLKLSAERQVSAKLRHDFEALETVLRDNTAALEKARLDLQDQGTKLQAATDAAGQAGKALQQNQARCQELERELAGAVAGRSELEGKLADEQQAFARLRQEFGALQKQQQDSTGAFNQARADFQQASEKLRALTAEADQTQKQLQETETRRSQLEQDLAGVVAGRSELEGKLADEQQASARLRQEFETLQKQQQDSTAALDQARADLQQASEKLRVLKAEADQTQKQLQETETRRSQLEQDLAGAVADRSELEGKLADEQQASARLRQEFEALQKQQQDSTTALNQARADLQQQSAERTRLESELQRQQESATASTSQTQAALSEQEARCGQLTQELTGLRQEHQETQARLAAEQETAAKSRQDSVVLQQQLNESMAALEQTRTELQQQKTERARWETERRNLAAANETLNLELTRFREQVESVKAYPVLDAPTETRAQAFRLTAPDAGTVLLVGDFTGWQKEPVPMKPGVDGVWSATVNLPPGTYLYMFVVDGEWREDPACAQRVPNEFGGQNMVRQVV